MPISIVYTRANLGIEAPLVTVEVHISTGMPGFHLVGLPETSVRESKDRVRSALINSGFEFPMGRITVNLAPADLPKAGVSFDLAIAIGILSASDQLAVNDLTGFEFIGELALSGKLNSTQGSIPMIMAAKSSQRTLVMPSLNQREISLIENANTLVADSLFDVYLHLIEKKLLNPPEAEPSAADINEEALRENLHAPAQRRLSDVIDQQLAKRALIIAASGNHNLLMFGPPGTGKSMLASRLNSLLPPLTQEEAITLAAIQSASGKTIEYSTWRQRPFRQPHHSSSATALVGGGSFPIPGEISLAHGGVLFLDELPEFPRHVLDVMREPLETGEIHLSRAKHKVTYPAQFQLIVALNPSPTGDDADGRCHNDQILRYLNKISGPLLDRIDLQVQLPRVKLTDALLKNSRPHANDDEIVNAVHKCRNTQLARQGILNAQLSGKSLEGHCQLSKELQEFVTEAMDKLNLSMRSYHRTLRVARTIADLANCPDIQKVHIAEALSYRSFDRFLHHISSH